jgi:hypothetical protein
LNAYFIKHYQELLSNPVVSGLAIYEDWAMLNPQSSERRQALRLV